MEFFVSSSVNGVSKMLSIVGRCGSEPVRPGAVFRAILREKPRRFPDQLESPREIEKCKLISICVQQVEMYGKPVDFLPANSAGVLRCSDYSVDLVPGGWILTDRCESSAEPGNAS